MNLLEINKIKKKYQNNTVIDNISFKTDKGEILCLLGPSGSGKTTLLRIIAGLEAIESGEVIFKGRPINNIPSYKRNFGMMFQEYALFPHKNVLENIIFGLKMQKWDNNEITQRARELIRLTELEGKEKRSIGQLSGGEQQRVALARSLAPRPHLILLDEPLASLDKRLRDHLGSRIKGILKTEKQTAIMVTHDQNEAFRIADKIGVLIRGRLIQLGSPEQIYRQPETEEVARFLGFKNIINCRKTPLAGFIHNLPIDMQKRCRSTLIRPDGFSLRQASNSHLPFIQGVIKEKIFQGTNYEIDIQNNNQLLNCYLPIEAEAGEKGSKIELNINPEAIIQWPA